MKTTTPLLLVITLTLLRIGLLPKAQAVNPPPDGGYPRGNTAEGQNALFGLTTGAYNSAVGLFSLRSNTTGSFNTANGAGTLLANTADENTATGAGALLSNTTGPGNTANGAFALFSNTTGNANTAIGHFALFNNTTGAINTANGLNALVNNTTGTGNTATGIAALTNCVTGNDNIALGAFGGSNVLTASNVICIGHLGENVDNSCYIGQIFDATSSGGTAVFINSDGRLGTITSSRRFKDDVKSMGQASEALFALKPVTFHYKKEIDQGGKAQFGLVAEEVEEVDPDLVVRDKQGRPYSVRYEAVNAMLLNEFLKEHKAFIEEQEKVKKLETAVASLVATVKEQTVQIQKVGAQVELGKPATKLAGAGQ
jgi:Chaperone of endosialidase